MEREVKRTELLPAFRMDVAELELLWERIMHLFREEDDLLHSISIELPSEQLKSESLKFQDPKELRSYGGIKGSITTFSIMVLQLSGVNRLSVSTYRDLGGSEAFVLAYSDNEIWCAGAIEVVRSFIHSHRVWYHWLTRTRFTLIVGTLLTTASVVTWLILYANGVKEVPAAIAIPIFALCGSICILIIARPRLFPAGTLVISASEQGFIRKHIAELALTATVISMILTLIQVLFLFKK